MKTKSILFVLLLMIFVVGCSSDDDFTIVDDTDQDQNDGDDNNGGDDGNNDDIIDFMPASMGNSWTYANEGISATEQLNGSATETMSVDLINGDVISFETQVEGNIPGLITGALANGTLEKSNGKYIYSGSLGFFEVEGMEFEIPLNDMTILDMDASEGDVLFNDENTFTQEIAFGELGNYNIQVSYNLEVTQQHHYDNYLEYENVQVTKITLSDLSIIIQGIPVIGSLELVDNTTNEALVSLNYFAEGVGLIQSTNDILVPLINLEDVIPIPLPGLPQLGTIEAHITQNLTDYSLN